MKGWAASVTSASRRSGVLGILMPALAEKAPDQPPAALTTVVPRISPVLVRMPATALAAGQHLQRLALLQQRTPRRRAAAR